MFNGRLKITVIEAKGLQMTKFMTRHQMAAANMEPYVTIDVDEVAMERTSTKSKTSEPTWNETFTTEFVRNAEEVGFTVFHDATIPPDDFIANCKINLSELIEKEEQPVHQVWVSFLCWSGTVSIGWMGPMVQGRVIFWNIQWILVLV